MDKQNHRNWPSDLAHWRKRLGLTQLDVAQMIEVTPATISDIEKGKNRNPITIALVIAALERVEDQPVSAEWQFGIEAMVLAAGAGAIFGALVVAGSVSLLV
jgi:DNA-binding XRE family transcriptional regulator